MKSLRSRQLAYALALAIFFGYIGAARAAMTAIDTFYGTESEGYGISGDGSVITGSKYLASGDMHGFISINGIVTDIGTLGGTNSTLRSVSSDGSTAVGYSQLASGDEHAIKYSNGTTTDIGTLGGTNAYANAVSGDGSIVVGNSVITGNSATHAFKYTTAGGMTDLGTLGGFTSAANGISGDGSIIVGDSYTSGMDDHAFTYTTAGGMVDIGTLGGTSSSAYAISSNGNVIVGESATTGDAADHAFKYTTAGGMTDLGTLGGTNSYANAVSGDGSVIVGQSQTAASTTHAFKYTGGTMTDLGTLGGAFSMAMAVSSDGTTITGTSYVSGYSDEHAFIYRSIIVDANNTVQAIANNAGQMNSLLNLKSSLLVNALDSDCAMYSDKGVCLALTGWHYSGHESALAAQSATTLKASYRFSRNFRAGALMDLAFAQTNPDNFNVISKAPLFGGFAAYGDNETGNGVQLRLAAAYNEADATITRTVLANTEAGQGESTFNSFGAKAEAGYGKTFAGWKTLPYLGVQWTNVSRNAYGEISGATFPVVYNAIGQRQFTALAGIKTDKTIAAGFGLNGGIGVEQDINNSVDAYTGTMDTLGSFNLARPHMNWTRPFANVGASYELAKDQRIGASLSVRRQTLTNTYGTLVSGQYTIAF